MKIFSKLSKRLVAGMAVMAMAMSMPAMAETFEGANDGSKSVPVTVTFDEADDTFAAKAMIPTKIDLTGKSGTYHVMAYYETAKINELNATLTISPSSSFTLTKGNSSTTTTANVVQNKTSFTKADINNGTNSTVTVTSSSGGTSNVSVKQVVAEGTITANGLSYGTWTGNLTFTISSHK